MPGTGTSRQGARPGRGSLRPSAGPHGDERSFVGNAEAHREQRLVALTSVLAAVLLTSLKIAVGLLTSSLGILSEAAHSGIDLVAAAVTLMAVGATSRPADLKHEYGHGKVENLSALVETVLLLATCVWIVWEAAGRLFVHSAAVAVTPASFAVMAISVAVDLSRARALRRVARKYGSQALEADALHFQTDVFSSLLVTGGLACVAVGGRLGLPFLAHADAVAALGVAAIAVTTSVRLGRKSIDDLLDAAPAGMHDAVARAALVPQVRDIRKVRLRRSGAEVFADIAVGVDRELSVERAHDVASAVEAAVRAAVPSAEAVVHVEPARAAAAGSLMLVRVTAARHGLGAHAIRFQRGLRGLSLVVHLEVDDDLSMGEVDRVQCAFERDVLAALPELREVHLHTEVRGDDEWITEETGEAERSAVRTALQAFEGAPPAGDLRVVRSEVGLGIAFRWRLPSDLPAAKVRGKALRAEQLLRERVPGVASVFLRLEAKEP